VHIWVGVNNLSVGVCAPPPSPPPIDTQKHTWRFSSRTRKPWSISRAWRAGMSSRTSLFSSSRMLDNFCPASVLRTINRSPAREKARVRASKWVSEWCRGTKTHCRTLQRTAAHYNTLQPTVLRLYRIHIARERASECRRRQAKTHRNLMQHSQTHSHTLQHRVLHLYKDSYCAWASKW